MLAETLTLTDAKQYDETADGVEVTLVALAEPLDYVYTREDYSNNRSTYHDQDGHTVASRNQVQFYRTYAKRSGSSRGSTKVAVKLTIDGEVPNAAGDGNIVLPLIVDMSFSVPVGTGSNLIANTLCRASQLIGSQLGIATPPATREPIMSLIEGPTV